MFLGVVLGEVWSTRKSPALQGQKLLLVRPRCWYYPAHRADHVVAVDRVGAGVGEEVLVCCGSPARWEHGGTHLPVEAAVMGIVDGTEITHEDPNLPFRMQDTGTDHSSPAPASGRGRRSRRS